MGVDENDSADFEFNDYFVLRRSLIRWWYQESFRETWSIEKSSVPQSILAIRFLKAKVYKGRSRKRIDSCREGRAVHVSMTSDSPVLISRVGQTDRVHSLLESLSKPCWDIVEEVDTNY